MNSRDRFYRPVALIIIFVTLLALLYSATQLSHTCINNPCPNEEYVIRFTGKPEEDTTAEIIQTRNSLSRQLNGMRKLVGRLQCEKSGGNVNNYGGWCKQASKEHSGKHQTDMELVKALSDFLRGKRVGSFGDGPGAYKRELLKLGEVWSYDAYDGAPYCEETSEGSVQFMDLAVPQYGIPLYDWILSLEVAEHIPKQYESIYLDNIFRHAKEGIILSWAVPGQDGLNHVNNQPLSYVMEVMKTNGFQWEVNLSKKLRNATSFWYLKQNINVYTRRSFNKLKNESLIKWYT